MTFLTHMLRGKGICRSANPSFRTLTAIRMLSFLVYSGSRLAPKPHLTPIDDR
jgi:hypothetical protein